MAAQYRHPEALASTEWLAQHLSDPKVRVVDLRYYVQPGPDGMFQAVSGRKAYEEGHIPGAVFMDFAEDLADPQGEVPLNILPPEPFQALMGRLGIGNDTTVVAYDDSGGLWAARLWWALRYYGHDAVKLLDGGLTKWTREGRPLEAGTVSPPPATFRARPRPELRADREEVRQAIGRPDVLIIDALPAVFYSGRARLYPTHRAGHIPGARNLPAPANLHRQDQTILPPQELEGLWGRVGLRPDKRVITYCGAGAYGAFDLFVLYLMGHERASLYDSSWMEWGANTELPVETGPDPGAPKEA